MNDIVDAVSSRVKAPYFGYVLLAFLALNWRAIFLLIALDASPADKLAAFDLATNPRYLYLYPFIMGAAATAISPWLSYITIWIAKKPKDLTSQLAQDSEHKNIINKTRLEKARAHELAISEQNLIDQTKRDEQIQQIEDPKAQEKLEQQIAQLRNQIVHVSPQNNNSIHDLTSDEVKILKEGSIGYGKISILKTFSGAMILTNGPSRNVTDDELFAIDALLSKGLIKKITSNPTEVTYEITVKGKAAASML